MSWTLKQAPSQAGRIAVVTGANIGLGYETALALAAQGCTVVLACRNPAKAEAAKATIRAGHPKARVECQALDLASLASVRAFAKACRKRHATRRYDKRLAYGQSKLACRCSRTSCSAGWRAPGTRRARWRRTRVCPPPTCSSTCPRPCSCSRP